MASFHEDLWGEENLPNRAKHTTLCVVYSSNYVYHTSTRWSKMYLKVNGFADQIQQALCKQTERKHLSDEEWESNCLVKTSVFGVSGNVTSNKKGWWSLYGSENEVRTWISKNLAMSGLSDIFLLPCSVLKCHTDYAW